MLIHGFSGDHTHLAPVAALLARAGFRTLRYDCVGRGYSSCPGLPHSPELFGVVPCLPTASWHFHAPDQLCYRRGRCSAGRPKGTPPLTGAKFAEPVLAPNPLRA